MALVLDAGPLYAALDRNDAHHLRCRRLIETAQEPLVVPAPVLVEVDYWIRKWLHQRVLVQLLDDIHDGPTPWKPCKPRTTAASARYALATPTQTSASSTPQC